MKQTEIFIEIDQDAKVSVEVSGHVGPGCTELTKNIEKALGSVVADDKKPEFSQKTQQKQFAKR